MIPPRWHDLRWLAVELLLIGVLAGLWMRCEPVDLVLLTPNEWGCTEYELAILDTIPPETVWTGPLFAPECQFIDEVGNRPLAARCDGSDWVLAVRAAFDPDVECGG